MKISTESLLIQSAQYLPPDRIIYTGKNSNIPAAPFSNVTKSGIYRINYYVAVELPDPSAGSVFVGLRWADGIVPVRLVTSAACSLTATNYVSGSLVVGVDVAFGNVTVETFHSGVFNASTYRLFATCEIIRALTD